MNREEQRHHSKNSPDFGQLFGVLHGHIEVEPSRGGH